MAGSLVLAVDQGTSSTKCLLVDESACVAGDAGAGLGAAGRRRNLGERISGPRTALREAYSKLSGKRLIIARPKAGTQVRPRADWSLLEADVLAWRLSSEPEGHFVEDLLTLRPAIEPVASEIAAVLKEREDRNED